jgi:hypothetical protein
MGFNALQDIFVQEAWQMRCPADLNQGRIAPLARLIQPAWHVLDFFGVQEVC